MRAAAAPPVELTTWTSPPAGHNYQSLRALLPAVLDWLADQMADPVPAHTDGNPGAVTTQGITPWPLPDTGTPGALHGTDTTG